MLSESSAPEREPETEAVRQPRSLRIVAGIFMLSGILSITEMVLQWTVFQRFEINLLAIVWILTGWGLLRWRDGWRRWAVFVTWLMLIAAPMTAAMALANLCNATGKVQYWIGPIKGSNPLVAMLAAVVLGLYAYWQLTILKRPDIVAKFASPPS